MFSVNRKNEKSNKSTIRTRLRAGFFMTPPIQLIHFENTTIEVPHLTWVSVSVRTRLMQKLKFGRLSACLLAKQKNSLRGYAWVRARFKNSLRGYAWVRARCADCCGPSCSLDTCWSLLTKVGTETRTVFSASNTWKVQQEQACWVLLLHIACWACWRLAMCVGWRFSACVTEIAEHI